MKILFHPIEAWGHMNATIGMAQIMLERGHQCIFVISRKVQGQFSKYGFDELFLELDDKKKPHLSNGQTNGQTNGQKNGQTNGHTGDVDDEDGDDDDDENYVDHLIHSPLFIEKDPLKKYGMFERVFQMRRTEILKTDPQMRQLIEQIQPDLIIVDQILVSPIILHSGIPWASLFSCNPICFRNDPRLPPPFSGLPSDDRTLWSVYRKEYKDKYQAAVLNNQNKLLKHYGYDTLQYDGITPPSPYLNIYGYPVELDYVDVAPMPSNCFRIDTFCRKETAPFELPKSFLENLAPGAKLIYISMGTLAAIRFDLIKKILRSLSRTGHGLIVSKGPFDDGDELPANVYGATYLPQTKVIPMVDLVITHGGNNTVTESFSFGKPLILMPFFVDQYDNAERVQEKGYGVRMDPFDFDEQTLLDNVQRLLNDQLLHRKLTKLSQRIQNSNCKNELAMNLEKMVEDSRLSNGQQTNQK